MTSWDGGIAGCPPDRPDCGTIRHSAAPLLPEGRFPVRPRWQDAPGFPADRAEPVRGHWQEFKGFYWNEGAGRLDSAKGFCLRWLTTTISPGSTALHRSFVRMPNAWTRKETCWRSGMRDSVRKD